MQTGAGQWHRQRPNFTANGFNFTWENDFAPTAVFGTATTNASLVRVDDTVVVGGIRFDPVAPGSGPFQIIDDGGTLAAKAGGATIESNTFARIQASLTGSNSFTKTGDATLQLDGDNAAFNAQLFVNNGTLRTNNAAAFGTGGFTANTKTTVADGATLQLTAPPATTSDSVGLTVGEHLHLSGDGHDGNGALHVSSGHHTFTERIALQADATLNISNNASATFGGGAQGRFYNPGNAPARTLTKAGGGTAVFDLTNNIGTLVVSDGVVAGAGGINGAMTVNSGAAFRPGDSADATGVGTFSTGDLTLDPGSLLTLDLDPTADAADQITVAGTLSLAGTLEVTLLSIPVLGDSFIIIENDGIDPVAGLFTNGVNVSSIFGGQTYNFAINYLAGSGNDVALTFVPVPEPTSAALLTIASVGVLGRRRREG